MKKMNALYVEIYLIKNYLIKIIELLLPGSFLFIKASDIFLHIWEIKELTKLKILIR